MNFEIFNGNNNCSNNNNGCSCYFLYIKTVKPNIDWCGAFVQIEKNRETFILKGFVCRWQIYKYCQYKIRKMFYMFYILIKMKGLFSAYHFKDQTFTCITQIFFKTKPIHT